MLSLDKSRQQQFHDLIVGVSLLARNGVGVTNLSNSYTNRPISSKGPQRTHNGQCNLRLGIVSFLDTGFVHTCNIYRRAPRAERRR